MRKMFLFLLVFTLAVPLCLLAQEQSANLQQEIRVKADRIVADFTEQRKVYELNQLDRKRTATEKAFAEYNSLIAERDGELKAKLQRALDDGDETLVKVAVGEFRSKEREITFAGQWLVGNKEVFASGEQLMSAAREAYREKFIDEAKYSDHLVFYRHIKAKVNETRPAELTKMIEAAREIVPEYLALLDDIDAGR